jgi:hypothetical protein
LAKSKAGFETFCEKDENANDINTMVKKIQILAFM